MINSQRGFTLIEIMIAMSVFSLSLLVITMSFVGLVRTQRLAGVNRATQQQVRNSMEELVRDVRASTKILECNSPALNGQALVLLKTQPIMYYRSAQTGGDLLRGPVDGTCTKPTSGIENLTSDSVEVRTFAIRAVADAPTPTDLRNFAVEVELGLGSDDASTTYKTVASTRGEAPGQAEVTE